MSYSPKYVQVTDTFFHHLHIWTVKSKWVYWVISSATTVLQLIMPTNQLITFTCQYALWKIWRQKESWMCCMNWRKDLVQCVLINWTPAFWWQGFHLAWWSTWLLSSTLHLEVQRGQYNLLFMIITLLWCRCFVPRNMLIGSKHSMYMLLELSFPSSFVCPCGLVTWLTRMQILCWPMFKIHSR